MLFIKLKPILTKIHSKKPRLALSCLALISGMLAVYAFAPHRIYPLALLGLIGILTSWVYSKTNVQAFLNGLLFGIGFFSLGIYWVFISIYQFGNAPIIIAGVLTGLLIFYLALFPAFAGYFFTRFYTKNNSLKFCLVFPAIWVLSEWVRSWIFTGFPWLLIGASQTNILFKGAAPIAGVLFISFLLAHIAGLLFYLNLNIIKKHRTYGIVYLIILVMSLLCLNLINWTQPEGEPVKTSLIQANIAQSLKWDPVEAQNTVNKYKELTNQHWSSDLIIWPEAAIPTPMPFSALTFKELSDQGNKNNTGLVIGVPFEAASGHGDYNAALGAGKMHGDYYKKHLVPYGEYFPAPKITRFVLQSLDIPMSDFHKGSYSQKPMVMNKIKYAVFICYEIAFSSEVLGPAKNANILLALSDDAWFGRSSAQAQQLQISQMRAMETSRYVVSATNNGLSAVINHKGEITAQVAPYKTKVLTANIQAMTGNTLWLKFGTNIILILCLIALFIGKKGEKRFPKLT